jgi:hypothetical protein
MQEFRPAFPHLAPNGQHHARHWRCLLLAFAIASFALLANSTAHAASESLQRAVLYDEDPSDAKGRKYDGSVLWRTVPIKVDGQTDEFAVTADIEIPWRKLKMTLSLRRNTDKSLPASHIAELKFVLPADFIGGGIRSVPGMLTKWSELGRGTPLAGVAVKVTDSFFMIGLSDVPADRAKNLELLLDRAWFDIPLVYSNGRRAIIAIEKGTSGSDALRAAFGAEKQDLPPAMASSRQGYAIQVSAHDSEAAALASYQLLQTKFPAVLGSRATTVKRVDGNGGVLYLAMVGPFATADEAFDVCERLKAAGGECIVQRN